MTTSARPLRAALDSGRAVVAPGAYDCITARLVQEAGFDAVYLGGACAAAALGYPDYGLVTLSEMAATAARITRSVALPVIADADTGYGGALNVVRTVREYERAGVSALHLEDQVFPKRCGHLAGKEVVPVEEFVTKIDTAVGARTDPDLVIIARSDALAPLGLDSAIERMNAALAAGADLAFIDAPETLEQMATIPSLVNGPCMINLVRGGKTPLARVAELESWGYRLVVAPGALMLPMLESARTGLTELSSRGTLAASAAPVSLSEVFQLFGAGEWNEWLDRLETA